MTGGTKITQHIMEGRWTAAQDVAVHIERSSPHGGVLSTDSLLPMLVALGDARTPSIEDSLDHYFKYPLTGSAAEIAVAAHACFVNRQLRASLELGQAAFARGDEITRYLWAPTLSQICLQNNYPDLARQCLTDSLEFTMPRADPMRHFLALADVDILEGDPSAALAHLEAGEEAAEWSEHYAEEQYQAAFGTVELSRGDFYKALSAISRGFDARISRDPELPRDSGVAILHMNSAYLHWHSGNPLLAGTSSEAAVINAKDCLNSRAIADALVLASLLAKDQLSNSRSILNREIEPLFVGCDPAYETYLAPTRGLVEAIYARALSRNGNALRGLGDSKDALIWAKRGRDELAVHRVGALFGEVLKLTPYAEYAMEADIRVKGFRGFVSASYLRRDDNLWR